MANQQLEKQDEPRPRDFGHSILVILKTLFVFIASQITAYFLVIAGYGVWVKLHGSTMTTSQLVDSLNYKFDHSAGIQFITVLLVEASSIMLVYFFLRLRKLGWKDIGLGRRPNFNDAKVGFIWFLLYYVIFIAFAVVLSLIFPELNKDQQQDVGFKDLVTPLATAAAFVGLVILPPIGEETLMRGYLYSGLRARMRYLPALVITSVMFGAAHLFTGVGPGLLWLAGIETFILSVVLVHLREKTGALYAGIFVHALNNVVAFLVYFNK